MDFIPHCEDCDCGRLIYTCPHCLKKVDDVSGNWFEVTEVAFVKDVTFNCDECGKSLTFTKEGKLHETVY